MTDLIIYEGDRPIALIDKLADLLESKPPIKVAKEVSDRLAAVLEYIDRNREVSLEERNAVFDIKMRYERYIGKLLMEMPKAPGGQPYQENNAGNPTGNTMLPVDKPPTYAELGISKMQSSRLQQFVKQVSDEEFEQEIKKAKEQSIRLNKNAMLKSVIGSKDNETESSIMDSRFLRCQYCNELYTAVGRFVKYDLPYCPKHISGFSDSDIEKFCKLDSDIQYEVLSRIDMGDRSPVSKIANKILGELRRESHTSQKSDNINSAFISQTSWDIWLPKQGMCDLLLTDPPYSTDVNDIFAFACDWLPTALSRIKPTGRAYICIGAYPDELYAYLSAGRAHMTLAQILVWTYRNATNRQPKYDYILNWQAILYFRGLDAPQLDAPDTVEQFAVQDINAPDARRDERYHTWQKPDDLAERLIRHSTRPGDLILDPFAGTGTFLLAAAHLGRIGRGCDTNPEMISIAKGRGCQYV